MSIIDNISLQIFRVACLIQVLLMEAIIRLKNKGKASDERYEMGQTIGLWWMINNPEGFSKAIVIAGCAAQLII